MMGIRQAVGACKGENLPRGGDEAADGDHGHENEDNGCEADCRAGGGEGVREDVDCLWCQHEAVQCDH